MSRPKDVINAKFWADSNNCVEGVPKIAAQRCTFFNPRFQYLINFLSGAYLLVMLIRELYGTPKSNETI
jgi:hypothetical protein